MLLSSIISAHSTACIIIQYSASVRVILLNFVNTGAQHCAVHQCSDGWSHSRALHLASGHGAVCRPSSLWRSPLHQLFYSLSGGGCLPSLVQVDKQTQLPPSCWTAPGPARPLLCLIYWEFLWVCMYVLWNLTWAQLGQLCTLIKGGVLILRIIAHFLTVAGTDQVWCSNWEKYPHFRTLLCECYSWDWD